MKHFFAEMLPKIQILKSSGQHVFDFGAGAPDLAPPHAVRLKLAELCLQDDVHSYSGYNGIPEYRNAVAAYYEQQFSAEVSPNTQVLPVIGSKEAIVHFCNGFLSASDSVLVPDPGYLTYTAAVQDVGAKTIPYAITDSNNFQISIPEIERHIQDYQPKLIILNTHHMPTGVMIDSEVLEALTTLCEQHNIVMLNDNPYGRLGYSECKSILEFSTQHSRKIELLSHSKMHNLAGWRIGAAIGDASLLNLIRKRKNLHDSGMSKALQLAAISALELKEEWYSELSGTYQERAVEGTKLLNQLDCQVVDYQGGMFLWAKCPVQEAANYCEQLLDKHQIFLVPGSVFGNNANQYLRMSLTQDVSEIQTCITTLKNKQQLA